MYIGAKEMTAKSLESFHCHSSKLSHKLPRPSPFILLPLTTKIIPHISLFMDSRRGSNLMITACRRRSLESCGDDSRDYFNDEYQEQFEYPTNISHRYFNPHDEKCYDDDNNIIHELAMKNINSDSSSASYYSSMSCWISSKLELFGPSFFGMKPNPPAEYWPEDDDEMKRSAEFAIEVQCRRQTLATKQKYYWQVAGDFSYCSVRKVFSLTVFMLRELLSYVLSIRECVYSEDLRKVIDRVQIEMNYTFVWLFESVFATTPTLMVSVMLLLVNFTAHSMAGTAEMVAGLPRVRYSNSGLVSYYEEEVEGEEKELWGKMLKNMIVLEERLGADMDREIGKVTECCLRTNDFVYEKGSAVEAPRNSLILLNSALFFNPNIPHLRDRVEECFKRAIMLEPWDADVRTLYADFLWLIKKDLPSAEENYLEAVEVARSSTYHISKYRTFLLQTGNVDICFPSHDFDTDFQHHYPLLEE